MCLLDVVLEWDAVQIRTASGTHRAPDHPLAAHGRLGAICGLEYAAQAMALHGALLASRGGAPPDQPPLKGYLASVRGVRLHVARLDDIPTELIAAAERITGNEHTASYELRVSSAGRALVEGRATVVFEAGGLADHSSGHASGRPNASVRP
jgi:predicted hotdog family 3-hydroxylacyl-ACP dehydratase